MKDCFSFRQDDHCGNDDGQCHAGNGGTYQWSKQLIGYLSRLMSFPSDLPPVPPGYVSVRSGPGGAVAGTATATASVGVHSANTATGVGVGHWVAAGTGAGSAAVGAPVAVGGIATAHNLTFVHDSPSIEVTPDEARRYKEEVLQGLQVFISSLHLFLSESR